MNKISSMGQLTVPCLLILCMLITTALSLSLRKQSHNQLKHQLYKDNLDAKNWYYGGLNATQYRLRIFKMTANGTVDICPMTAPFSSADNTKCQNCPLLSPLRNLQTNLCQTCPSGYIYNPNNGNCSVPLPIYNASAGTNGTGTLPGNQTTLKPKQIVPNTTLSYASYVNVTNTTNYTSSGGAASWDAQAVTTPTNTTSNTNTTAPSSGTSNATINNTSGVTVNTTTVVTTNTTGTTANTTVTTITNTTIPVNTTTNTTTVSPATNITTTTNTTAVLNYTEPAVLNNTSVQPITNTTTTTNTTTPSSTNTTTVSPTTVVPTISTNQTAQGAKLYNCSTRQPLFNYQTGKCETCPVGYEYIMTTNVCLPDLWKMNSKATNFVQPSPNYVNNLNAKIAFDHPTRIVKECPANMPYLVTQNNVSTCISCNTSQYFAVLTMKCIDGCPQGTIYNSTQNVCSTGLYATNPATKNIASPTNKYDKWKQELTKLQNASSNGVVFCPDQTPYQSNGTCISCPNDKPYFNIDTEQCIGCKQGKVFSQVDRKCKGALSPQGNTQKYTNPSLTRMIVNLF